MDFSPSTRVKFYHESRRLGTYGPFLRNFFAFTSSHNGLKSIVIVSNVPTELSLDRFRAGGSVHFVRVDFSPSINVRCSIMRAVGSEHMHRSSGTPYDFTPPGNRLKSVVTICIVPPELLVVECHIGPVS